MSYREATIQHLREKLAVLRDKATALDDPGERQLVLAEIVHLQAELDELTK